MTSRLSSASSTEKRAKSNLKTAADIYSKTLGIHAGLTLSTRIQLARFETDKKTIKTAVRNNPPFRERRCKPSVQGGATGVSGTSLEADTEMIQHRFRAERCRLRNAKILQRD